MIDYEQIGKNTYELVQATEWFTTLMYFLHEERDIQELKIKIGTFDYDNEWIANIYCVLKDCKGLADIYFYDAQYDDVFQKESTIQSYKKQLTDFCFGWEFDKSKIKVNWDIVNDFRNMLTDKENDIFVMYYDEIHNDFW